MTRLSRPPVPFVGIAAEDETVIRMGAADVLTEAGFVVLEAEHTEKAEVSGSRMQIRVGYDLTFDCPQPLPMIVHLNVHYSRASDLVRPDHLLTVPTVPVSSYRDSFGNWVTRLVAPAGGIRVTTDALVLDSGLPDPVFPDLRQHPVQALPSETLLYLVPRCFGWVATWLCGQLQVEFPGEEVDDGFEVSDRAIASCLGLGGLDQTVDALDEAVGNLAVEPAQDAVPVTLDGVCRVYDGLEPAVGGPEIPFLEIAGRCLGGGLIVEFLECEADPVGTPGLEMARRQSVERGPLQLRQIGRVAQPDVAGAAQQALPLLFGTAHLVDRVVDDLDGMELVESDFCIGQAFAHTFDEGRAHVDADFADRLGVTAMGGKVIGEGGDGGGVLAFGGEQHPGLVDIDEQREVVVAAPGGGLVDGDPGHAGGIDPRPRLLDIVVNHAPQPRVVLAHNPRHCLDRHGRDHGHHQRLEQQSEAAIWPRPGHVDRLDAASLAAHARHAGRQIGLMLEEVEMGPGFPLGVVGRAARGTAGRTGETAAWSEVDLDVEPVCLGVEVATADRPRRGKTQRLLQQSCVTHDRSLARRPSCSERGAVLATVKDAARRAKSAMACGHP